MRRLIIIVGLAACSNQALEPYTDAITEKIASEPEWCPEDHLVATDTFIGLYCRHQANCFDVDEVQCTRMGGVASAERQHGVPYYGGGRFPGFQEPFPSCDARTCLQQMIDRQECGSVDPWPDSPECFATHQHIVWPPEWLD